MPPVAKTTALLRNSTSRVSRARAVTREHAGNAAVLHRQFDGVKAFAAR